MIRPHTCVLCPAHFSAWQLATWSSGHTKRGSRRGFFAVCQNQSAAPESCRCCRNCRVWCGHNIRKYQHSLWGAANRAAICVWCGQGFTRYIPSITVLTGSIPKKTPSGSHANLREIAQVIHVSFLSRAPPQRLLAKAAYLSHHAGCCHHCHCHGCRHNLRVVWIDHVPTGQLNTAKLKRLYLVCNRSVKD